MTNLEKLRTGTDEEIRIILTSLAYRSNNYNYQELQVREFLKEEIRVNYRGEVIL